MILTENHSYQHSNIEKARQKRKIRVLTVDDDDDVTFSLKTILKESGLFEVHAFTNPEQALSHFKANTYDLVILDIRMPKMDGFELYRKIKILDDRVKICFLTSVYDYGDYRSVYPDLIETIEKDNGDCFCIIDKPIGSAQLIKQIIKTLQQK